MAGTIIDMSKIKQLLYSNAVQTNALVWRYLTEPKDC